MTNESCGVLRFFSVLQVFCGVLRGLKKKSVLRCFAGVLRLFGRVLRMFFVDIF